MSAARATHSGCICDGWAPVSVGSGKKKKMEGISGIQRALECRPGLASSAPASIIWARAWSMSGAMPRQASRWTMTRKPARRSCSTLVLTQ